jgi:hypothetical protein
VRLEEPQVFPFASLSISIRLPLAHARQSLRQAANTKTILEEERLMRRAGAPANHVRKRV